MTPDHNLPMATHALRLAPFAAMLAILVGLAVLAGWALDATSLKSILPIWVAMKANTALCFVLIGIALRASIPPAFGLNSGFLKVPPVAARFCALMAGLIGLLTLGEYLFGWSPGLDQWLFHEPVGTVGTSHPGRMAPESALCFLLLATALSMDGALRRRRLITIVSISIGLTVTSLALAAMLSYLTPQLGYFGWFGSTIMAMHTAILFALLGGSVASLCCQQNVESWALGKNITLTFALGLFLLVVNGLTISRTQFWLKNTNGQILLAEQMQDEIGMLRARVAQSNADIRDYLFAGDERHLKAHLSVRAAIETHLNELRHIESASGEAMDQRHFAQVEGLLRKQLDWQQQILDARQAGAKTALMTDIMRHGAVQLEALHSGFEQARHERHQIIENLVQASEGATKVSYGVILGGTISGILIFLIALFRLNSSEAERKDAERALTRNEQRYRSVIQSANDAIVTADSAGRIAGWNRGAEMAFGYTEAEISGQPLTLLIPERFRDRHLAGMDRVLSGAGARIIGNTVELNGLRKDGGEFPMELSLARWEGEGASFFTGTIRDITSRKSAEEQLRKLSQAVEQSPESILITNLKAEIEYANEAFLSTTGYLREEVIGRNPRILQSGKTPPENYASLWEALTSGGTWQGELYNRRKDGSEYTESAIISPIREPNGRTSHYVAVKKDITELKRAADQLRESKTLLQRVIDSTPDWIYVKDLEHRFMLVNRSFANAFNQSPENMIGRHDIDFVRLDPVNVSEEDGMRDFRNDDRPVVAGQSIHDPCERIALKNGESRIFDTFKGPLRDSSQNIYGVLCYRRDITERFNKEQEQRSLEMQLRQAQKMELIGHLTGGIAHDFNNILAAIFGYAELMQMSDDIARNDQLKLYLQEILRAGIRAKELVAQLLTFSQKGEPATEAISVTPIVREVAQLLRSTLPTSISISTVITGDLPQVLISPVQLHQVLMNLAINARDAIADSGTIEVRTQLILLDDSVVCKSCHMQVSGSWLMISVRDNGSGIPQGNLPKIFDPFFTTKTVGRGSGLGLSVLHGIVHSANGHIDVQTTQGVGTEFRVYLPAQSPESEHSVSDSMPGTEFARAGGHVMVVDDEESIVGFLTVMLENLGCRVTGATSSKEALRLFEKNPNDIDLVITDQTMPDLTGAELARAMLACRPDIAIVLSTGYSNSIDEATARQMGIRRFINKPVPAKILADVVAEFLPAKEIRS